MISLKSELLPSLMPDRILVDYPKNLYEPAQLRVECSTARLLAFRCSARRLSKRPNTGVHRTFTAASFPALVIIVS